MGHLRAQEAATVMTEMAGRRAALDYHLTANHYPPVPRSMISVCEEAIERAVDGDYDGEVELPDGIEYQGRNTAPVYAIVSQHHLDAFIEADTEGEI